LRKIAAATGDLADLRNAGTHNSHSRTHRVAVTLRPYEFEIEEMTSITAAIVQQQGRITVVCDNYVHEAVVIEVGKGDTATHVGYFKPAARLLRRFNKFAIAFIVK